MSDFINAVWETVQHWPWATIAAFAAAAAAIWAVRLETRDRDTLLARETVVDVNSAAVIYHREVIEFLTAVRAHIRKQISSRELNDQAFPRLSEAITAMDRHLKTARMNCNDFTMQVRIAAAEMHIAALLETIDPARQVGIESQRDRLDRIIEDGFQSLQQFGDASEALVQHGFDRYSPRRGLRYRIAKWRWDRTVKAEQAKLDESTT
jgi:hypothetical protein